MRPTSEFDPEEWGRVYDDPHARGQFAVFRRSADVAREHCESLMRVGDLWLDLGSGTGHLVRALRHTGARLVGVDHSAAMLRHAGEGAVARAERLPFADGACDGIVAVSLIGCLEDAAEFYAEVRRILRPGGHAVMTYTNAESLLLRLNYAFSKPTGMRFRHFRLRDAQAQLEHAGFVLQSSRYYNCVLHAGGLVFPTPPIARLIERTQLPMVGRNFVVVARARG
jgi:SAM-dependent methyltransferase